MKSLSKILTIIGLCLMVSCLSNSPSGKIDAMQKRVDKVEKQVEVLYNQDFKYLIGEFQALDTTLQQTNDISTEMELMQAYLQQFQNQRVVIKENVKYSRQQLSDLKDDIEHNVFDDATAAKYMKDEEDALHMMEAQISYFKEKFDEQKKVVKKLRKE